MAVGVPGMDSARRWNQVQGRMVVEHGALPLGGEIGLMRPSLKDVRVARRTNCYRNQDAVLWGEEGPMLPPEQRGDLAWNRIHQETN